MKFLRKYIFSETKKILYQEKCQTSLLFSPENFKTEYDKLKKDINNIQKDNPIYKFVGKFFDLGPKINSTKISNINRNNLHIEKVKNFLTLFMSKHEITSTDVENYFDAGLKKTYGSLGEIIVLEKIKILKCNDISADKIQELNLKNINNIPIEIIISAIKEQKISAAAVQKFKDIFNPDDTNFLEKLIIVFENLENPTEDPLFESKFINFNKLDLKKFFEIYPKNIDKPNNKEKVEVLEGFQSQMGESFYFNFDNIFQILTNGGTIDQWQSLEKEEKRKISISEYLTILIKKRHN